MADNLTQTPDIQQPSPLSPEKHDGKRIKALIGALIAIALVVGLYFVNRFWIAPATRLGTTGLAKGMGDHPLAPQFSLVDISGQKLDLANYTGKVVMLAFCATWCGPC